MEKIIGIDLGTTNSCVAVVEGENAVVIPAADGAKVQASIVSFLPDGRRLVGNEAREQLVYNPYNTVFSAKRLIGRAFSSYEVQTFKEKCPYQLVEGPNNSVLTQIHDRTYTIPEIGSFVLKQMKSIAENYLGEAVNKAVITVPANFNDQQRNATKQAGELAGLEVVKIINEPTAAALSYGFGKSYEQKIAVYDFGGGTFDISVLQLQDDLFEVISTAGDTFLGGDDIGHLIVQMIVNSYKRNFKVEIDKDPIAMLRVQYEAERAKQILSSEDSVNIQIPSLVSGPDGMIDLNVALNRTNFEKISTELIKKSFVICDEAMRLAKLHPSEIENVILVGGTTMIPLVRSMVEEYFGRKPFWGVNPEEVVALGAAIEGAILAGEHRKSGREAVLLDVTSLSLGIATVGGRVERIIERNTPIPVERTRMFTTSRDSQEKVHIRIYQGESDTEDENELMGELELSGLNPNARRGEAQIAVTFEIDTNGIVQVNAIDKVTGLKAAAEIDLAGEAPMPTGFSDKNLPGAV